MEGSEGSVLESLFGSAKERNKKPFTWKDYFLVVILTIPILLLPWIAKWHEFLVPIYVSGKKSVNREYVFLTVYLRHAFQCLLAIVACSISDLLNKHYAILCICLEIFTFAQVYGMIIYYIGPYEAADLAYWMSSTMHAANALILYVIFSQNQNAYRFKSHLVLAVYEFANALSTYGLYWVVTDRHRTLFVPLGDWKILPWVAIFFLMATITGLRFMRRLSPVGSTPKVRFKASAKATIQGIKDDCKTPSAAKFGLFLTFLVPAFVAMAIDESVLHVDMTSDGKKDIDPKTDHFLLLGSMAGMIMVEACLFAIRKLNLRLSDMLSLGLPLIFFLAVTAIIYPRLKKLRPLQELAKQELEDSLEKARVFEGPIPNSKQAVIEFYNIMNDTIEIASPHFVMDGPLVPHTRTGVSVDMTGNVVIKIAVLEADDMADGNASTSGNAVRLGNASMLENVSMPGDARRLRKGSTPKCSCVFAKINAFHSYIIHGNESNIGIIHVDDHEHIKPDPKPTIVIMNSFMRADEDHHRILVWEETLVSRDLAFYETFPAFSPNQSIFVHAPVGGVKITYENIQEDLDSGNPGNDESTNVLITEPFVVYTILITMEEGKVYMDSFEIMRISIRRDDTPIIPKIQSCYWVGAAFFLMGAGRSSLTISILHHFWMDSPMRLRATLLAGYISIQSVLKRAIDYNTGQLEVPQALTLMILQSIMVVSHFVVSSLFFFHYNFGYPEAETEDDLSSPEKMVEIPGAPGQTNL